MSNKFASQRQVLATIGLSAGQTELGKSVTSESFANFFAQVSGGEITASVEKIYRGGATFPETLCAPAEIGDITLTDFVDAAKGAPTTSAFEALRQYVGRAYFDITVSVYDCDIAVAGSSRLYSRSLLVGLTEADGDSSSGAPATYAMTFSVSSVSVPTNA